MSSFASGNPYSYCMDNVQPIGAAVYTEVDDKRDADINAAAPSEPTSAGKLIIPRTDHLPVLPDAGHVTDIVSSTESTPWFAESKPDLRDQAYEKATC